MSFPIPQPAPSSPSNGGETEQRLFGTLWLAEKASRKKRRPGGQPASPLRSLAPMSLHFPQSCWRANRLGFWLRHSPKFPCLLHCCCPTNVAQSAIHSPTHSIWCAAAPTPSSNRRRHPPNAPPTAPAAKPALLLLPFIAVVVAALACVIISPAADCPVQPSSAPQSFAQQQQQSSPHSQPAQQQSPANQPTNSPPLPLASPNQQQPSFPTLLHTLNSQSPHFTSCHTNIWTCK